MFEKDIMELKKNWFALYQTLIAFMGQNHQNDEENTTTIQKTSKEQNPSDNELSWSELDTTLMTSEMTTIKDEDKINGIRANLLF